VSATLRLSNEWVQVIMQESEVVYLVEDRCKYFRHVQYCT